MCKLVTRSTPYWPCEGWRLQLFPPCFDGSLGVCSLHPSVQGPDDRSCLSGVFRLYICSGWNEMHQNWRKWQKQRQDCLFRWGQFYPKWWVEWGLFFYVWGICVITHFWWNSPSFLLRRPLLTLSLLPLRAPDYLRVLWPVVCGTEVRKKNNC